MVSRDSRRRCLLFSNSINLFVGRLSVVLTPEITISFRLGGAAIVGWRGQSIKRKTIRGSLISNARFLKLYFKITSVANQMLEAAVTGTVPDVGPPNTLEEEVALRPMCVQLKVRLPK